MPVSTERIPPMAKVRLTYDDKELRRNINDLEDRFDEMIAFIVDYHAAAGQVDMKTRAPWTDRTSAARNGLFTVTEHSRGHYTIIFSHTVHYGIWLEVKFSGRDAVIMPTVKSRGHALMDDIRKRIS